MDGIADYQFVRQLSEVGHGVHYLAVPPERLGVSTEYVGVKIVPGADDEASLRRITRELRAFAAVDSPYLVTLLDAGRQDFYFFYATEYCELGSLSESTRELTRAEKLRAIGHAARAAHAMHEAGLVHRGIRPSNVLLKEDGARLADLGLVQALKPEASMTGIGAAFSVEYLHPSVLGGELPSPATDLWSLGLTAHKALTGKSVFGELPPNDFLLAVRKILTTKPEISAELSAAEADLITRCLSDDPFERFRTALDLAEAVDAAVA